MSSNPNMSSIPKKILSILDRYKPEIKIPIRLQQIVDIPLDDNTYVYGKSFVNTLDGEAIEPYIFEKKAEISDPEGSYTEYYESKNLFIVYDSSDNIIRIIKTSTCRSDDFIKYEFNTQSGKLSKVEERYKGIYKILFHYINGICSKIELDEGKRGCYRDKIGDLGPIVNEILGWYFNE
tara:strand:- start:663 stop:1199 length:537 start_codon:yes stop_codon:yes gene_type:complete